MKANSFRYLVKEGAVNVWLNRLMSLASIGVLTTCLLLIGFSWLLTANINSMVDYVGDQNEIVFFIKDEAAEEEITAAKTSLENDSRLFDVVYIDKEAAMEEYKGKNSDLGSLMEGLEGENNPLPASFRFKVEDISKTSAVVEELGKLAIADKINAPTDVADTLTNVKDMVNGFGLALVLVLIVVSLVIIANTIRATVFSRRREINIMKYVGATNNFIRLPFFVEGVLIGAIAAVLAFFLIWGGYSLFLNYFSENASSWLSQIFTRVIPFGDVMWPLFGGFLASGVFVGIIGSTLSVRNHLKV